MADEQRDVRVGQWQHAVGGKHGRQTVNVQGFEKQHKRRRPAFLPHGTLRIAQALGRLETKRMVQRLGLKHVEQGLVVNIVEEAHQPFVGSLVAQRHHEGEQVRYIRRGIKTAFVKDIHRLVFLPLSQQGVEAPPRQTVSPFVNVGGFEQVEPVLKLLSRAGLGFARCVLPSERSASLRQ